MTLCASCFGAVMWLGCMLQSPEPEQQEVRVAQEKSEEISLPGGEDDRALRKARTAVLGRRPTDTERNRPSTGSRGAKKSGMNLLEEAEPSFERRVSEAQDPEQEEEPADVGDEAVDLARYRRNNPSDAYVDPLSEAFIHGYISSTFAAFESEFGEEVLATPQILVGGSGFRSGNYHSGFQADAALMFGAALSEKVLANAEIHFVRDATDPVLTEMKIQYAPDFLQGSNVANRLTLGRYWWPFGIHNEEWFSNANLFFLLSPAAAEVVPAHFNENGIMLSGEWVPTGTFAFNYLVSVGNGVSGFELMPNVRLNQFDDNSNRTVTARIGVFPNLHPVLKGLEIGFSASDGELRGGVDATLPITDPRRFSADFTAFGVDVQYGLGPFRARAYSYVSDEEMDDGAPREDLDRSGFTGEVSFEALSDMEIIQSLVFKLRASWAEEESITAGTFRRAQYGFGVNWSPEESFLIKLEYFILKENGITDLDNDGVVVGATVSF